MKTRYFDSLFWNDFFPQIHLHQLSHLHLASELDSQGYSSTILCYNINGTSVVEAEVFDDDI